MNQKYTQNTKNESEQKCLIAYIATDEKLRKDILDTRVVRGMFDESDHY